MSKQLSERRWKIKTNLVHEVVAIVDGDGNFIIDLSREKVTRTKLDILHKLIEKHNEDVNLYTAKLEGRNERI